MNKNILLIKIIVICICIILSFSQLPNDCYAYTNENEDVPIDEDEYQSALFGILMIVVLAPIYLPLEIVGDENDEPLKFQKYPFEESNGFYHEYGKDWGIHTSVIYHHIKDYNYGFESKINADYKRFGLQIYSQIYKQEDNSEKKLSFAFIPFYTFARSRFLKFQTGLGYNYERNQEEVHGIIWNYQINLYSKPIHIQISNDLKIGFPQNKEHTRYHENLNINISYCMKHISFTLGYYFNSVNKERLYGPYLGLKCYF